jgi:hypothetical protein
LRIRPVRVFTFALVERSRVRLFAPLRDKVTSSNRHWLPSGAAKD